MKKITLLLLVITLVSCGKSKEEQMIYDYVNHNGYLKGMHVDLKDTDFKIESIEKVKDIKYKDSIDFCKTELAKIWDENYTQELKDTLSFDFVLDRANGVLNMNKEIINKYIDAGMSNEAEEKLAENKRFQKTLTKVNSLRIRYEMYKSQDDRIISTQYKATTSMTNPILKAKQTYTKYYYTNADNTEIIKDENFK